MLQPEPTPSTPPSLQVLFMLGEEAGSCLRIIGNDGNRYNKALMGYVLQSHVRALVVLDGAGSVLARSLVRLLLRSDTMTPVIFCDPIFFTKAYTRELRENIFAQARHHHARGGHQLECRCLLPVSDGRLERLHWPLLLLDHTRLHPSAL